MSKDYTAPELEALDMLGRQSLMDGWVGFVCSYESCEATKLLDPELAVQIADLNRKNRRLKRACGLLLGRGLVEQRQSPYDRRFPEYRLIPMLRGEHAQAG